MVLHPMGHDDAVAPDEFTSAYIQNYATIRGNAPALNFKQIERCDNLMPLKLSVDHVTKAFDGTKAIDDINFQVQEGEIIGLVGPSGSGKSTLMNLIVRMSAPTDGCIFIDGQDIQTIGKEKEYAKQVGMLRQQFDLIHNLSVINNVLVGRFNEWGFGKSLLSMIKPQDKDLAEAALLKVGLADKIYERTATLSGGEQQRVAIARLLLQNPSIILADEPVSALDPANAHNILRLLTSLVKSQQKTLIASMHSVELAREYFDRLIGISEGQIVFDKPAGQVTDEMLRQLYGSSS